MPFCNETSACCFSNYPSSDDGYAQPTSLLELASPIYSNKRIFLWGNGSLNTRSIIIWG